MGPEFDKGSKIIDRLPDYLVSLLQQMNGFIQYDGGLQVRGVCKEPISEWMYQIDCILMIVFLR